MPNDDGRRVDPNATIQVDPANVLDQIQLVDAAGPRSGRKTPPPLPPSSPSSQSSAVSPARGSRTAPRIAVFVALIAIAIVSGLLVGRRASDRRPAAGGGAAAPSASVLTIPPVEIR